MNRKYAIGALGVVVVLLALIVLAIHVRHPQQADTSGKVRVSASFYPLYFFSKQIGGDKVTVDNVTPAGAEPHDYEPSTQDIARIESANMLVLNGSVEAWGDKVKQDLAGSNVIVVTAGTGLLTKQLTEEGETMSDPHVWLDPVLAKQEAHAIEQGLATTDPSNAEYYARNEAVLDASLDQLDSEYKASLSSCKSTDIITSHAAFAYLSERYGLHQLAIAGLSPDEEPSPAELADVSNFARAHDVHYIFFESLVSPRLSETIANEVGAQTLVLDPIEGISDEDLARGADYFSVMRSNLQSLKTALHCSS